VRVEPVASGAGEGGEVFLAWYYKAFLLSLDECRICSRCAGDRAKRGGWSSHLEGEEKAEKLKQNSKMPKKQIMVECDSVFHRPSHPQAPYLDF
jgi:hypothetical protein